MFSRALYTDPWRLPAPTRAYAEQRLALVCAVSFSVTLHLCAIARAQPPEAPCVAEVIVTGDEALADSVRAYLSAQGVTPLSDARCGSALVHVVPEAGRVRVSVTDTTGRDDTRLLTDAATAAVFVESRVRADLAELPEVGSREPAAIAPTQPAQEHRSAPQPEVKQAPAPIQPAPVSFTFQPGFSLASDRSSWLDLSANGCVQVALLCLGATLRASLDLGLSGRSAALLTERAGVDVLVTAVLPVALGSDVVLRPGVGIGAGWLRAGPRGAAESPATDEVAADFGSLRFDLYLSLQWRIAPRWGLGISLYGIADPLAHTRDIRDPDALLAGNPRLRAGAALMLTHSLL